tara:strand:- start:3571 stop:4320 length:750 start_codon:yes stop_codon:yes gene_type:complete
LRKVYRGDLIRFQRLCDLYKKQKRNFKVERSGTVAKIFMENREMFFIDKSSKNNEVPKLCKSVIFDVKKWVLENPKIELDCKKVVFHNRENILNHISKTVVGYDIISCYWEIAYRDKIISKKTYESGVKNKEARTLAIGNLNKKTYQIVYSGQNESKKILESKYSSAYNYIIKEVQKMYNDLNILFRSKILSWRTDCIYLPKGNEVEIKKYFESKKLQIKSSEIKILQCVKNKVYIEKQKDKKQVIWNL